MKRENLYLVVLLLLLCGCAKKHESGKLSYIRELSENYPDSALALLETHFIPQLMREKDIAEWCMLNGSIVIPNNKAKVKADIDTLLLRRTISYFSKKKRYGDEAQARLYYGRMCVLKGQYQQAVVEYKIALEKAKMAKEYNLQAYIGSYLADAYYEESNFEDAFEWYKNGIDLFLTADNMRSSIVARINMGLSRVMQGKLEEALEIFELADSLAHVIKDEVLINNVLHNIGFCHLYLKNYEIAEEKLLEVIGNDGNSNHSYSCLSRLYIDRGQYKKALETLDKMEFPDEKKTGGYWGKKTEIYKSLGEYELACEAMERLCELTDQKWAAKDSMRVTDAARKYDYSRIIEENIILANESKQRLIWILLLMLTSLIIYIISHHIVVRKNQELMKKQKELEAQEQLRKENDLKLKAKELELQKKSLEYQQQQNELELLKNKEYVAKQSLLKRSLTFKKLNMLSELPTKNINAFKNEVEKVLGSATLSETDWEEIKSEINYVYPDFTERIILEIPRLTEEEIRFCCLLKVGLDTPELSVLLRINPESVNRRRARINKKIREIYPESSWYEFLKMM